MIDNTTLSEYVYVTAKKALVNNVNAMYVYLRKLRHKIQK